MEHWLAQARDMHNAARDNRQAMMRCVDRSDAGSWAAILPYCTQITVREDDSMERDLDRRLALRKAARLERNPHKRGHLTRAINRSAS